MTNTTSEASTKNLLGLALGTNGTTSGFLLDGWFKDSASVTVGAGTPIYINGTAGSFSSAAPASGFVRVVGWVVENNIIYFRPDCTWIEL